MHDHFHLDWGYAVEVVVWFVPQSIPEAYERQTFVVKLTVFQDVA